MIDVEVFGSIKSKKFSCKSLSQDILQWGYANNFKLIKSEGTKNINGIYMKVMICAERGCNFRITFKSDQKDGEYQLDEKLAKKNNKHSKVLN